MSLGFVRELDGLQRGNADRVMRLQAQLNQSDAIRRELEAQVFKFGRCLAGVWPGFDRRLTGGGVCCAGCELRVHSRAWTVILARHNMCLHMYLAGGTTFELEALGRCLVLCLAGVCPILDRRLTSEPCLESGGPAWPPIFMASTWSAFDRRLTIGQ
jgi:hypothetical protein